MQNRKLTLGIIYILIAMVIGVIGYLWSNNQLEVFNKDNGVMVQDSMSFESINELVVNGHAEVEIVNSTRNTVFMECSEKAKPQVACEKGSLTIDSEVEESSFLSINRSRRIKLIVYADSLRYVRQSGVGKISSNDTLFNDINIVNEGVGKIDLLLNVTKVNVRNSGVGKVSLSGFCDNGELLNEGVGSTNATHLKARMLIARNAGVGSMKVYATDSLSVTNEGVGSLKYKGDAHVYHLSNEGVGSLKKE